MAVYLNPFFQKLRWDLDVLNRFLENDSVLSRRMRTKNNYTEDLRLTTSGIEISREVRRSYIEVSQLEVYSVDGELVKYYRGLGKPLASKSKTPTKDEVEERALSMYKTNTILPFRPTFIAEALDIFSKEIANPKNHITEKSITIK